MSSFGEAAARLSSAASILLGWRPDDFWNCTPMELAIAMSASTAVDGPDAQTIEELRRRFPDDSEE
jgi:uncharacterized phage protein (TIGR02216 family)